MPAVSTSHDAIVHGVGFDGRASTPFGRGEPACESDPRRRAWLFSTDAWIKCDRGSERARHEEQLTGRLEEPEQRQSETDGEDAQCAP
jgi:hypothetical protein